MWSCYIFEDSQKTNILFRALGFSCFFLCFKHFTVSLYAQVISQITQRGSGVLSPWMTESSAGTFRPSPLWSNSSTYISGNSISLSVPTVASSHLVQASTIQTENLDNLALSAFPQATATGSAQQDEGSILTTDQLRSTSSHVTFPTITVTTSPPGFSTEATTNSLWTGNTWITTESHGRATIVPVLVGCHRCGGTHGGIILWNFPEIPDVSFEIPEFPSLPTFHFPCIQVLGIKINCPPPSTTESTEGSDSSDSAEDPESRSEIQSEPSSSISSLLMSSVSTSSSSSGDSSSSSTCSAASTASDCSIVCSKVELATLKARILPVATHYTGGLPQLLDSAYRDPETAWVSHRGYGSVTDGTNHGLSSALSRKLDTEPFMIGAKDLVGCTVITVLSRRGIWMGHFWEKEGFTEGEEQFEREVIDAIIWGDGPEMPSLSDAARQYFGPDPQDNYASSDKIFILTVLSNGDEQAMGQIAFPAKIDRIVRVLSQVITGDAANPFQTLTTSLLSAIPIGGTSLTDISKAPSTLSRILSGVVDTTNTGASMVYSSSSIPSEAIQPSSSISDSGISETFLTSSSTGTAAIPQQSAISVTSTTINSTPNQSHLASTTSSLLIHSDHSIATSIPPLSSPISSTSSNPIIPLNPAPTTEPPPPYVPGTCNIHIREAYVASKSTVWAQLSITDGAGHPLGTNPKISETRFGKSIILEPSDTNLPYAVSVTFTQKMKPESRMKPRVAGGGAVGPTLVYQKFILELTAGGKAWNSAVRSGMPKCTVGDWDNGDLVDWLDGFFADPHVPVRLFHGALASFTFHAWDANSEVESPDGL
ncbi:hypothetical protein BKA65DRAFT_566531 [Rhexocercosporidium sp. MPI-PUGE-AT-0058]|nr:hypothetical protein BKA65DRAFT_566531 [Rhexocercosporidium sp. MPI-PUGE-AT-0058]